MGTGTYTASLAARRSNKSSNFATKTAYQGYHSETPTNICGIIHFGTANQSGKRISAISLTITSSGSGSGSTSKVAYLRESKYQSTDGSATGANYYGDLLCELTSKFYNNTVTQNLTGTDLSSVAAYLEAGNTTFTLWEANASAGSKDYSSGYLCWTSVVMNVTYEDYAPTTLTASRTTCPLNGSVTFTVDTGNPDVASYDLMYDFEDSAFYDYIVEKKDIGLMTTTFTIPYSWKSYFSGSTAELTVSVSTYDSAGNLIEGAVDVCFITLTIPKANAPTINYASFSDTSTVYSTFGVYVQGHSQMAMSISASADSAAGASISNYSTTVNGSTYSGSSFTIGKVGSTSLSARVTVTDSEGQTASKNFSCTLAAYSPPSVSNVRSGRCDSSGNDKQDGTYMKMSFTVGSTALGSKKVNAVSYSIMYKLSTASGWTTYKTVDTGTTSATVTDLVLTGVTFDTDKAYDLKVVASDYFQTSEVKEDVSTKEVLINLMKGGKGIAFGQLSQIEGAIEMGWRTVFHEREDSATSLLYIGNNAITSDTVANWVSQGFCYGYYSSKYLTNQPTSSGFILSMPYCTNTHQAATSATTIVQLWVSAGNDETVCKRYGSYSGFGAWNEMGGMSTLKKAYPVGSIYMSTVSTNPATLFGFGTWTQFAAGRMPMGAGGGYSGTGGSATVTLTESQIPSHSHAPGANTVTNGDKAPDLFLTGVDGGISRQGASTSSSSSARYSFMSKASQNTDLGFASTTASTGGGQAHNNLPPYIVCYMWQRTA